MVGCGSSPITSTPVAASRLASRPVPHPMSITFWLPSSAASPR
jgi:hypothetical protein